MGYRATTPEFRASFVSVFKPKAVKGDTSGTVKYSVMALFPKGADLKALKEAAKSAAKDKWGDTYEAVLKHPKFKMPIKDQADLVSEDGNPYAGTTPGALYCNFASEIKPGLVDEAVQDIIEQTEFYSGCYARAKVEAYAWEHPTGGKGVSFELHHVQRLRKGDPLGGAGVRSKPQDDFEPVAVATDDMPKAANSVFD